uniref:Protein N-terminal glutamine amidohydrolase n=1 Tax=Kalanchoe fedtschenkoi TaxID=63787 RepID=A0A7N1A8N6_KALFE
MAAATISQFHHTPYYCEENVYMLCKKLCELGMAEPDASDLFVLFISNDNKQVCPPFNSPYICLSSSCIKALVARILCKFLSALKS